MIKVLIVEDSPVIREFLSYIINSDPDLKVVGMANDGEAAIGAVQKYRPDVVTMDIHMPGMDGFEATRQIMETQPTPIVVVSASSMVKEVAFAFRAVEAGALAVIERPRGIGSPEYERTSGDLIRKIKLMSEIKVVRRWAELRKAQTAAVPVIAKEKPAGEVKVVAIGSSTGGPLALLAILSGLPRTFPVPILIVQHIVSGFIPGFCEWLADSSQFPVRVAADLENVKPGTAYVAPDGFQMGIDRNCRIKLSKEFGENGLRPSVDYLFHSVAEMFKGGSIGVLLSGMGNDGAHGLKSIKGGRSVTIAQDEQSCVVYGMPGEAVRMGAATYILPLSGIAPALMNLTRGSR